jgi:hypothetical protein
MTGEKIILSSGEGRAVYEGVDQKQIQLKERNVYVVVI